MKTRERKQQDLTALTEQLQNSKSAMVVGFSKLTVTKDQEFREQLRSAGAKYQVVKNTIVRRATQGTQFEGASEHFKGVTAIAWTDADAVVLSKTVSKFVKDNAEIFSFKVGVVDGKVVDLKQVQAIASLPSKEVLISKLLFVLNSQAQRLATVINAVPRNLAVVIKQIGDAKPAVQAEQKVEPAVEAQAAFEESQPTETAQVETAPAAETVQEETAPATIETAQIPEQSVEAEVKSDAALETEQIPEQNVEVSEATPNETVTSETVQSAEQQISPEEATATPDDAQAQEEKSE